MVKYKTSSTRIVEIVKEKISLLDNYLVLDLSDKKIVLKKNSHVMTINMKKEGEFLLLLINLDLDNRPSSDLAAQKFQLKVLSVIDKELSEIEKTTESKNSLLSLESSFKKLKTILYSTIGIICAVFGFVLYSYLSSGTNVDTILEKETDYFVNAQEYYEEFIDNEVRAGLKYKDKVIEIRGEVKYVNSYDNGFEVNLDAGWISSVRLKFPESERYEFSTNYNEGDFLSAKCFGTGGSSTLKNCELK